MKGPQFYLSLAAFACAVGMPLQAGLISNGGFEADFAGWTRQMQPQSGGDFFVQTGVTTPILGMSVPAPPEGTKAAMTDAEGPGSYVLYQDFLVPMNVPGASLIFSLLIRNSATDFVTPDTLDYFTPAQNQQFRVDILRVSSDPFSLAPADVLFNAYRTDVGEPLNSGYTSVSVDLSSVLQAHVGETLRLRFAQTDNVNIFNTGIDAVDVNVGAIPEPSTWTLTAGALAAAGFLLRRRRYTK